MIDPAHRLQHPTMTPTLVSQGGKQPKSQSFAAAFSNELAATRGTSVRDTSSLPSNFAVGQQNATRLESATATATATTSPAPTSTTTQPQSFDSSYWASQPAAVQQLRNIEDPTERADVATQLAGEGYSIDVPIMVWGWDPQITTAARESMGYTWVPSATQQPVEVAPGLTFDGTSYNAAKPPAGSISV